MRKKYIYGKVWKLVASLQHSCMYHNYLDFIIANYKIKAMKMSQAYIGVLLEDLSIKDLDRTHTTTSKEQATCFIIKKTNMS